MKALDAWCETHGATYSARWEFEQIIRLAGSPRIVLELGAHCGASLRIWSEAFDPDLLIGVEAERTERTLDALAYSPGEIVYGKTNDPQTYADVCRLLEAGPYVDFLYIDADHRFGSVLSDYEMYAPLVRDGGLIVLDDAWTMGVKDTEVYRYVPILQRRGPTALIYGGGDSGGKLAVFR